MLVSNINRNVEPSEYLNFDSELHTRHVNQTTNAELWIISKICFVQRNPNVGNRAVMPAIRNKPSFIYKSWTPVEWDTFKRNTRRSIINSWDNNFFLIPSNPWGVYYEQNGQVYRPNVKCRLSVEIVEIPSDAHLVINCYNIPIGEHATSFMDIRPSVHSIFFHSNSLGQLDSLDNNFRSISSLYRTGAIHRQSTVAHEFGHYLGLEHVNYSANPSDGSADICYRGSYQQETDRLGVGDRIATWHSYPWKTRLKSHLLNRYKDVHFTTVLNEQPPVMYARHVDASIPIRDSSIAGIPTRDNSTDRMDGGTPTRNSSTIDGGNRSIPTRDNSTDSMDASIPTRDSSTMDGGNGSRDVE